ncbi:hypothetical protein J2853_008006 [Streptosporangium lutulentum]|uniref:Peptidase C14 caspase domain-containing protein n=1 Tax=Streptosporangium lutulentum TaxID=1461250 RepID=A0ABT9QQU3_9ACTN|nr:hypothetical protein [Streptosporangium lutulentum]
MAGYDYQDPGLRRLRAPAHDAEALAGVLRDPQIGGFDVRTMLNEPAYVISEAVEEFFADRSPNDLLLVHFSCHGVKDESGDLYFATVNTKLSRLSATAVAADFVNRLMNRSRSRRIVLLLDCCYAGAFERGMTARADTTVGIGEQFGGRGRAVITASSAMEYAFEGDQPLGAFDVAPSVFTGALVEGLTSGEADRDQDGWVTLDELYDYIFDKVREATPHQTPGKWTFGVQGDLRIARRGRPVTTPVQLPPELRQAIDHPLASIRGAVVKELQRLMAGDHPGLALSARLNLQRLADDDSRIVAAAARAVLGIEARPAGPVPPRLEPSASVDATPITDSETRPPEKTSDPRTMRAPEAEGGRESMGAPRTPGLPPGGSSVPGRSRPDPDPGEPPRRRDRRLSARTWIFTGIGSGVALILILISALPADWDTTPPSTGTSVTAPPPTGKTIFRDDFTTSAHEWENEAGQRVGEYKNGAYRLSLNATNAHGYSLPVKETKVYPHAPPSLRIDVDVRFVAASGHDFGYGIACHADRKNSNGYAFAIWGKYVHIGKLVDHDPYYKTLKVLTESELTKPLAGTIKLQAACIGDDQQAVRLILWVNGQMFEATDRDDPLPIGTVALLVATGDQTSSVEAEFDNFVVRQI